MTALHPCAGCRRHIDAHARVCPFCGVFGRLSRAAVFAGVALASTACGGTKPKPVDQQVIAGDAGVTDTGKELPQPDLDPDPRRHRSNNGGAKMPYGAPPASRRLV